MDQGFSLFRKKLINGLIVAGWCLILNTWRNSVRHKKSPVSEAENHIKGNDFQSQVQTIFHYLQDHVATASMVSKETGIPQKNITRYKRDLEKADMLWEIEKKACEATGFKAWYLTTDPEKAPLKR